LVDKDRSLVSQWYHFVLQASIHSIKSRYPDITSLRDFFVAKYGENSPSFKLAQVLDIAKIGALTMWLTSLIHPKNIHWCISKCMVII
jgi:hypothetical protein